MLSRLLFDESLPDAQPVLVTHRRSVSWGELRKLAQTFLASHGALAKRRVGLAFDSPAASYAALAALDRLACDVFLFNGQRPLDELLASAARLKLGAIIVADDHSGPHTLAGEAPWSGKSTVTVLTSGSTGEPKAARHSWESMARPVRKTNLAHPPVWMLSYLPNLYAGLQVMLQCFADRGTLVIPDREMDPRAISAFMLCNRVQFISATPSYWRRLLMFGDQNLLKQIPLQQITLGGEVVDQALLDSLRLCYPTVRLVHIYATTELGRCFAVNDARAGFPVGYLDSPLPDGTELSVRDGELLVRSLNSMRGYDSVTSGEQPLADWFSTGDLVEAKLDRLYFVGRKSEMINVAGSKVYPLEVERVIRYVPGVSDVRVFGKSSSIAGELVACEIVLEDNQEAAAVRERVVQACRANLTSYQQPRLIQLVQQISLSPAGKISRAGN